MAKNDGGIVSKFMRLVGLLIILGFFVGVMRVFNWDFIALVNWIWNVMSGFVLGVSDLFSGNESFRKIFSAPN